MGWISLSLRKLSLKAAISDGEFRDIELSRQVRQNARNLSYEQSIYNADKTQELNDAREAYTAVRKQRPSVDSDGYADWQNKYADAKEDYEREKNDIEDYYDGIMEELEYDATNEEERITEEQSTLEAQLEAWNSELEAINDQISTDIDNSQINLGGK